MGRDRLEGLERDTREREERFRLLKRLGEFVPGQREPEPLAAGKRDEG